MKALTAFLTVVFFCLAVVTVLPVRAQETEGIGTIEEALAKAPKKTLWQTTKEGGPVMIPIGFCSVAAVMLIVEQFLMFSRKRFLPADVIKSITAAIEAKDLQQAYEICTKNPMFLTKIIRAGLEKAHTKQEPVIRTAIEDVASRESEDLQAPNHHLSTVAVIAPMLGLFGTVTGMIQCFNAIAFAGALGKPTLLAAGVAEALITTAGGLIVGIPAMTVYLYFRLRIRQLLVDTERITMNLVEKLVAEPGQ